MTKNIELIEVLSDIGAGKRGAAYGAVALQKLTGYQRTSFFSDFPKKIINSAKEGYSAGNAKHIEAVVGTCQRVCDEVYQSIVLGNNPIIISGDHSNATGTIAGLKKAKPDSVLGIIWIDAHADLHSPYTTPSGNMHGMPLAASIAENNEACAKRSIHTATRFFWEKLIKMGGIWPKLSPSHIIYLTLRDFEEEEAFLVRKYGINSFSVNYLNHHGVQHTATRIFNFLKECTDIYVSFDVDCLDPSVSRGTGLPVAGGLMAKEAIELIDSLLPHPKISCLEITEFNPFLDKNNETARIICQLINAAHNAINMGYYIPSYHDDSLMPAQT